jgi:iron complex transport system ATP-binding protein
MVAQHVLELDRVSVKAGSRFLLADIDLRVESSELVVIVGPNGAGKSTLLRLAAGLLRASGGVVRLDGVPMADLSPRERAGKIGWLPQRPEVSESITVLDLVATGRFRFRESEERTRNAALSALAKLDVSALASRTVPSLSGGELQRVAFATVLAQECPLLLLDEPSASLDPSHQIAIYTFIGELRRAGAGVLCVTHDINLLGHAIQGSEEARIVGLAKGSVRFVERYGAELLPDKLADLFDVEMRKVDLDGHSLIVATRRRGKTE